MDARYVPIREAAVKLGMTPNALRIRCQRKVRCDKHGRQYVEFDLGVRAFKFEGQWRFIIPDPKT